MKRKPDAILTADIHLREDTPVCRIDNFWETQARKIEWLVQLQQKYGCPIIDAGDVFGLWKVTPFLLQWAIKHMPKQFYTIPGNHDLPSHNLNLFNKSGLRVLEVARFATVLYEETYEMDNFFLHGFPWGSPLESLHKDYKKAPRNVAVCHIMTFSGRKPWPGCKDPGAGTLLKKLDGYDLIITGHNHKTFIAEDNGRILVNPGSLMRTSADQADHKPCVFLWYASDNSVEQVFVPIEEGAVSREHLDIIENRDERIEAFVTRLCGNVEISLSFENNLEEFFSINRVRKNVKDLVWDAVKGGSV